ncbi:hypothetical protein BJ166DRAFT_521627 [Pestalotiopsis sp. NC0098]|nr:hypothetical protein BJ166DRAFT_521627 [Pestalotiopsis sp. NC0098]
MGSDSSLAVDRTGVRGLRAPARPRSTRSDTTASVFAGHNHAPLLPSADSSSDIIRIAKKWRNALAVQNRNTTTTESVKGQVYRGHQELASPTKTASEPNKSFDRRRFNRPAERRLWTTNSDIRSRKSVLGPVQMNTTSTPTASDEERAQPFADHDHDTELQVSDDSESSGSDEESNLSGQGHEVSRFINMFRKLQEQRTELRSGWKRIYLQRGNIHDVRQQKDEAYRKVNLEVSKILGEHHRLGKLFQNAKRLDLLLQDEEANFDDVIDEYQERELQVELEERRFFTNESISRPNSSASLRGISGVRPDLVHPLFERFKNAVLEIQNQEEWKTSLQDKEKFLKSLEPTDLTEDDEDFLRNYWILSNEADKRINFWINLSSRLERECRNEGVIPEGSPYQQEGYWRNSHQADDIYLDTTAHSLELNVPQTLCDPRYTHLLSNPKHLLSQMMPITALGSFRMASSLPPAVKLKNNFVEDAEKEVQIEHMLSSSKDKDNFLDCWLLQRLRLSPMEVDILWTASSSYFSLRDEDKWQHAVLAFWFDDEILEAERKPSVGSLQDIEATSYFHQ